MVLSSVRNWFRSALVLAVVSTVAAVDAAAQVTTWDGDTSTDWNNANNWTNGVPTSAVNAVIPSGTLFSPNASAIANAECKDLTLNASATLSTNAITGLSIFGNSILNGTLSGQLVFTGTSAATLTGASPLPITRVDKATGSLTVSSGTVVVNGALSLETGALIVTGTLNPKSTSTFSGGSLTGAGVLDLDGNVTFSGTASTAPPTIRFSGANWVGHVAFDPATGTTFFDKAANPASVLTGVVNLANVEVSNPGKVSFQSPATIDGTLTIKGNGELTATAALDVNGAVDLDLGGTFNGGSVAHTFAAGATLDGTLTGTTTTSSTWVFDTAGNVTLATAQGNFAFNANLTINKPGTATFSNSGAFTIAGNLVLTSGILTNSSTMTVNGTSLFNGGSLTGSGTLDMNGNATFAGCSVTQPPAISCAGNWTADGAFNPSSNTVTFDAPAGQPKVLSGPAANSVLTFNGLTIAASAVISNNRKVNVRSTTTIQGVLNAGESFDFDGSLSIPTSGATFSAAGFTHTFASSITSSGLLNSALGGSFVFDGNSSSAVSVTSTTVFPNTFARKAGGNTLTLNSTFTIQGALQLEQGNLTIASSPTGTIVTVNGNATFLGGNLTGFGTLDVNGNMTFNGSVVLTPPTINCSGQWTANALFNPNQGSVTLDGTGTQTIGGTAAQFSTLTINVGSTATTSLNLRALAALNVNGALSTSAALDCDGSLTIGTQGALTAGDKTHSIGGAFSCSGNFFFSPGCALVFDTNSIGSISSNKTLPPVTITKVGASSMTVSSITIGGSLIQNSGPCTYSGTSVVNGNATFNGGTLLGTGTLDVNGNVVMAGAQTDASVSPFSQSPSFLVSGNWIGHPNYQPLAGTVTFDPAAPASSTISGTGVRFFNLTASTSTTNAVIAAVDLSIRGALTINGVLDTIAVVPTGIALDVDGSITGGAGATLKLGNKTQKIGGSLSAATTAVNFAAGAKFVFDGSAAATIASLFPLPPIEISKASGGTVSMTGTIQVNGDLTQISGTFSPSGTVNVTGNANFQGGTFGGSGLLDVVGNVTFNGTTSSSPADIRLKGNWVANALFQPSSGLVTFNGAPATQTVSGSFGAFYNLLVSTSAKVTTSLPLAVNNDLTVSNGTLTINSPSIVSIGGDVSNTGTLSIQSPTPITVGATLTSSSAFTATNALVVDGTVSIPQGQCDIAGGTFGDDLLLVGGFTSSAPITLVGAAATTLQCASTLPALTISKSSNATVSTSGSLNIANGLTLNSGTLSMNSATVTVVGNAQFNGGVLTGSASATLDVSGNVTFAGTAAFTPPSIVLDGNFTPHPLFLPSSGSVTFDNFVVQQSILGNAKFNDVIVSLFGNVKANGTVDLQGNLSLNGGFDLSNMLVVEGNLAVNGGGVLFSKSHDVVISGNLTVSGSLGAPTGTYRFEGPSSASVSVTSAGIWLPNVVVAKSGPVSFSSTWVAGTFIQESGQMSTSGTGLRIDGDATFNAGTLVAGGPLDFNGDVIFAGSRVTAPPTITCAGDWTVDSNFNPASGSITFDGTTTQVLSGEAVRFDQLQIAQGAIVTVAQPVEISNTLIVNGSFTTTSTLDVQSTVTVNTGAVLNLGAGSHRFAGSFNSAGALTATGMFTFDGTSTASQTITSSLPIPSVTHPGPGDLTFSTGLVVQGDLLHQGGDLSISGSAPPVTVNGNATFSGGTVSGSSGVLDVNGNVTFNGTTATSPPTIKCQGSWASDVNFTPLSGIVEFDGVGSGTVTSLTLGKATSFSTLQVTGGNRTVIGLMEVRGSNMLIQTGSTFSIPNSASVTIDNASVSVNGALEILAGGTLLLGDAANVTIEAIGFLRLSGNPALNAEIDGLAGGNYTFTVKGNIAAQRFRIQRPDINGFKIDPSATFAAIPNDFRFGVFDRPQNVPNACLLQLQLGSAKTFDNLTFQNSDGAINVNNVKVTTGAASVMNNAAGTFAGAGFESDPSNLVSWTTSLQTNLTSLVAIAGASQVTVQWVTIAEGTTTSFTLERKGPADVQFVGIATIPAVGPSTYQQVANGLIPNQPYQFRLKENVPPATVNELGTVSATPFSGSLPPNIAKVGPSGTFATIQAAINAAALPGSVIMVQPGAYPTFTVNTVPVGGLRILPDGTGVVSISTAAGPVTVQNIAVDRFVEIGDFAIGSQGSAFGGVVVQNCPGLVLLDELIVQAGLGQKAVVVSNSPRAVIQRSQISSSNSTGLELSNTSKVTISDSNVSSIVANTASSLVTCELVAPAPTLNGGSTTSNCGGIQPTADLPEFGSLSNPLNFSFASVPNQAWIMLTGTPYDYFEVPAVLAIAPMPLLLSPFGLTIPLSGVSDATGATQIQFLLPPDGLLLGKSFGVQLAVFDGLIVRLSNGASVTIIP